MSMQEEESLIGVQFNSIQLKKLLSSFKLKYFELNLIEYAIIETFTTVMLFQIQI